MTEIHPIFVSLKAAAHMLGVTTWDVHKLCEDRRIESRYIEDRRVVSVESLTAYAESLPTERQDTA